MKKNQRNLIRKRVGVVFIFLITLLMVFTGVASPVNAAMPGSTAKSHYDAHGSKIGYFDDGYMYWADRYKPSSSSIRWRTMGYRIHVHVNGQSTYVDYSTGGSNVAPYKYRSAGVKNLTQDYGGYRYTRDGINYNTLIEDITAKNATIGRNMSSGVYDVRLVFDSVAETYYSSSNNRIKGPFYTAAQTKAGLAELGMGTSSVDNYYGLTTNLAKTILPIVKYVDKSLSFPNGGGFHHSGSTYFVKPGSLVYLNTVFKSQGVNMTEQYLTLGDRRSTNEEIIDDFSMTYSYATRKATTTNGSSGVNLSSNSTGPSASNANKNSTVRNAFTFNGTGQTWWAYTESRNQSGNWYGGSSADALFLYAMITDGTAPTIGGIPSSAWNTSNTSFTPTVTDWGSGIKKATIKVNGSIAQTITPTSRDTSVSFNTRNVTGTASYVIDVEDNVGNKTSRAFTVNMDKIHPSGNVSQTPTSWTNGSVTLNLTSIADTGSPDVDSGYYRTRLPNGNYVTTTSASLVVTANGTYSFVIYDKAGNSTTKSITVSNIDKNAPTANVSQTPTGWTNGNVSVSLSSIADTGGSGYYRTRLMNGSYTTSTAPSQTVSSNGVVSFVVYDRAGNATTKTLTVTNIDNVAPTGNVAQTPTSPTNGNVTLNLTAIADSGGSGYYRTRLPNGNHVSTTSASQVVTANGTYSFVIYDKAGNSTTKSITVSNIDKNAPTANVSQTPTGWTNGNVSVSLSSIADTGGSGYYRTRLMNGSYTTSTTPSQTMSSNGAVSFVVYDKAGNSTTKVHTVSNIDKIAPTGNLAQSPTAPTNGNVTLNLTAISDSGGSGYYRTRLPNGTFVTTTTASQVVTANGTYSFVIYDKAGNATTKTISVTNIDKIAPTGTLTQTPTSWTKGNVTLNLTSIADSGGAGYYRTKLPNGTFVSSTTASQVVTGNGTYSFVIYDRAGNSTTKTISVSNIERTPPTGTLTQTPIGWTKGNVTLNLTSIADSGGSGVKNIKLPSNSLVTGTSASQVVTENGAYSFVIYDNAGNSTTKTINVTNIERVAPTGTLTQTPTSWTNGNVTLNLQSIADAGGSGYYRIKLPNGSFVTTTTASQTVTTNGSYSFVIYDNAGNSTTRTITVSNIDKLAPTGTLTQTPTSWTKGNVTLNLKAISDTGGSDYYRTRLPNGNYVSTTTASQLVTANGTYSFIIYDHAGNSTTKTIAVSNIDRTAPSGTLKQTPTAWTNGKVTLNLTGIADSQSGIRHVKLPNGNLSTSATIGYAVTANGTYVMEIEDIVGNKTTRSITVTNIDRVKPVINFTGKAKSSTEKTVNVRIIDTGDLK